MSIETLNQLLLEVRGLFAMINSYSASHQVLKVGFRCTEPETEYELICVSCTYLRMPTVWDYAQVSATFLDSRTEHIVILDEIADVKIICQDVGMSKLI